MVKRRDEGGGGRRNPPEKGREGDRGEEYVSSEEVRFSLLYSRTMDRLNTPHLCIQEEAPLKTKWVTEQSWGKN